MAEAGSENLEELKAVIKEKTKENKNLAKKIQKLEEGYVKKHTELSEVVGEKENFIRLFKLVFPDRMWDRSLTTREYENLEQVWTRREDEMRKSVQELSETLNREVVKWKAAAGKKDEEILEKDEVIAALRGVETMLSQTQASLAESKGEIAVLEKQLENLRLENAALRNIQDELAKTKASSLLAALDQRPTKADPVVELEKTQKQLAAALKRIEDLENLPTSREHETPSAAPTSLLEDLTRQRIDYEHRIDDLKDKLEAQRTEFQEHRKKAQKMIMEKEMMIERLKQAAQREHTPSSSMVMTDDFSADPVQQLATLRLRIMELERTQGSGKLSLEYLRNIIAKYMEYMNAGNMAEAKTLEKVIVTALEFAPEEVELIEKAKGAGGIVNRVTTLLSPKSPGLGVSHNTLHTIEGRKRARLQIPHSVNVSLSNTCRSAEEEEKYEVVTLDKP